MEIMEKHNKWLSLECVKDIHKYMSIPISNIQSLCLCVTLRPHHPEMIDTELTLCQYTFPSYDISSTTKYTSGVTDKLALFQRFLKNTDGTAVLLNKQKFKHTINLQDLRYGHKKICGTTLELGISTGKCQMKCIQTNNVDLRKSYMAITR